MNEDILKLEAETRASPEYAQAFGLLTERERLEQHLHEIDHQLDVLALAGKLAKIDRLRQALLVSTRGMPSVG